MKESYTYDWFTHNATAWPTLLEPFHGIEGLRFLEIGSFEGRSACWLLRNVLTAETSTLTCVDIFPDSMGGDHEWMPRESHPNATFDANIVATGMAHKVTKLRGRSEDLLPALPSQAFDFIYIDGSHVACDVLTDTVLAWRCLKPGGVMCFDDYLWGPELPELERPKIAIDAFLRIFDGHYEMLLDDYQLAIRRNQADAGESSQVGQPPAQD